MSIATDTARIKRNVSAALAAIAGKGVTVPEGSTSDAMAGLIEAIEAGGGGTILGYNLLSGTITLSEETTDTIILVEGEAFREKSYCFCAMWNSNIKCIGGVDNNYIGVTALTGETSFAITSKGSNAYNRKALWANNNGKLSFHQNDTYKLKPGVTYCWIMLYRNEG